MEGDELDFSATGRTIRSTLFLLESNSVSMQEKETAIMALSEELNRSEFQISLAEKKQREVSDTLQIEINDFERSTENQKRSMKTDKEHLITTLEQLEKEQERLRQKNLELACQFQEVEERLARLAGDFSADSSPASDDTDAAEMDMSIEGMRQEISELSNKSLHVTGEIGVLQSALLQKESMIVRIKRELLKEGAQIKKLKGILEEQQGDYKAEMIEKRREFALHREKKEAAEEIVANLKANVAERKERMSKKEEQDKQWTAQEKELNQKKRGLGAVVAEKQKHIRSIAKRMIKDEAAKQRFSSSQHAMVKEVTEEIDKTQARKAALQKDIRAITEQMKQNEKQIRGSLAVIEDLKRKVGEEAAITQELQKEMEEVGKSETESAQLEASDEATVAELQHELITIHQAIQAAFQRKNEIDKSRFTLQEYPDLKLLRKEFQSLQCQVSTTLETNEKLTARINRKEQRLLKQRREEVAIAETLSQITNTLLLCQREYLRTQSDTINNERAQRMTYAMDFLRLKGNILETQTRTSNLKFSAKRKASILSHILACRNIKSFRHGAVLIGEPHAECAAALRTTNQFARILDALESFIAAATLMTRRFQFASYPQTQHSLITEWRATLENTCQQCL